MLKILRIINRLNLGGPTYNAAYLSKYLEADYETKLLAGKIDKQEASSRFIMDSLDVKVHTIRSMHRNIHLYNDWLAYREIKNIIRTFKPDIIHTHAAKAGALGRLAAYRLHVPVIIHTFHGHVFHHYFNSIKTLFFLKIERFLAHKSQALIALSKQQKDELVNIYKIAPAEKFKIIPLGFDLHKFKENSDIKRRNFRKRFGITRDDVAIGIVGRFVPIKNHRLFLFAISKIAEEQRKHLRIFIVGDGETMNLLTDYCTQLNLDYTLGNPPDRQSMITFTSWITVVDELMAGMDIIALSSDNEGTPVSLIEAQAAGKPIVSTCVGGVADIVVEGRNALLSMPNDAEAFAANISAMIKHLQTFTNEAIKRVELVHKLYDYHRLVEDMSVLYKSLLQEASDS